METDDLKALPEQWAQELSSQRENLQFPILHPAVGGALLIPELPSTHYLVLYKVHNALGSNFTHVSF